MKMIETIKERYQQLQSSNGSSVLTPVEQNAFNVFNQLGIPSVKHEEWKYTRISSLFNKEYAFAPAETSVSSKDIDAFRLPGSSTANELVFVNGVYQPALSIIRSQYLSVLSLEEATKEHGTIILNHLGHSDKYIRDGIHALNTAFLQEGQTNIESEL